jgi:hypothetical protein
MSCISGEDLHIINVIEQYFHFDKRISALEKKQLDEELEKEAINKAFKDVSFQDFVKLFCYGGK